MITKKITKSILFITILFFFSNINIIFLIGLNPIFIFILNLPTFTHLYLFYIIGNFNFEDKNFKDTVYFPFCFYFLFITVPTILKFYNFNFTGILWIASWYIAANSSIIMCISYTLYSIHKHKSINQNFLHKRKKKYDKLCIYSAFFGFIIAVLIIFSPIIIINLDLCLTDNTAEIKDLSKDLTKGLSNETEKTLALLEWFDRGQDKEENFANIYYRKKQDSNNILLNLNDEIFIFSKPPYFCSRGEDYEYIFCAKCGMCEETSKLFYQMAYYSGLETRRVICKGEDHDWNEVKINDQWVIVDATAVNLPRKNGFNFSSDFMENKIKGEWKSKDVILEKGNVSYVYAENSNDGNKKIDITYRYTDIVNITVITKDKNNNSLENVTLSVYSLNSIKDFAHDRVILKRKTNSSGVYTFSLGGGKYKFKAEKGDLKKSVKESFSEDNDSYDLEIVL